jgi:hypothetical protein
VDVAQSNKTYATGVENAGVEVWGYGCAGGAIHENITSRKIKTPCARCHH